MSLGDYQIGGGSLTFASPTAMHCARFVGVHACPGSEVDRLRAQVAAQQVEIDRLRAKAKKRKRSQP